MEITTNHNVDQYLTIDTTKEDTTFSFVIARDALFFETIGGNRFPISIDNLEEIIDYLNVEDCNRIFCVNMYSINCIKGMIDNENNKDEDAYYITKQEALELREALIRYKETGLFKEERKQKQETDLNRELDKVCKEALEYIFLEKLSDKEGPTGFAHGVLFAVDKIRERILDQK